MHSAGSVREIELLQNARTEAERYAEAREAGDFDVAAVIAGEVVGLVDEVMTAKAIVSRLAADAESLIDGGWRDAAR